MGKQALHGFFVLLIFMRYIGPLSSIFWRSFLLWFQAHMVLDKEFGKWCDVSIDTTAFQAAQRGLSDLAYVVSFWDGWLLTLETHLETHLEAKTLHSCQIKTIGI